MRRYYVEVELPTHLLCERAVRINGRYLLYEYDQKSNTFIDSGYANDLEDLKFKIRARYGFHKSVYLAESFEEAVKLFEVSPPRVIHLSRDHVFCVREGDVLFSAKWDYDANHEFFIKRMKWELDGEEPESIAEALKRLSEYAERHNRWIVLRHLLRQAVAYEVYPDQ